MSTVRGREDLCVGVRGRSVAPGLQVGNERRQEPNGSAPPGLRRVDHDGPLPQIAPPQLPELARPQASIGKHRNDRGAAPVERRTEPFDRDRRQRPYLRDTGQPRLAHDPLRVVRDPLGLGRPSLFAGRVGGLLTRLSADEITNVHAGGSVLAGFAVRPRART